MVHYRSPEEIELLRVSNRLVGRTHGEVSKIIRPGITTADIDKLVDTFIRDHGGTPAFKGFQGFPGSACTSVNKEVVHGIPGKRVLKEGDVISVDIGVLKDGYYGDSAYTYPVGRISEAVQRLLTVTKTGLYKGIAQAVAGNRIGDVGFAIQQYVEREQGYHIVRELVGHGVGQSLHEDPEVPNYGKRGQGLKLREGLVIAIEPMVNMKDRRVVQQADGWTVTAADKLPSAHFEHTVAVQKGKAEILSTFEFIAQEMGTTVEGE